MNNEKDIIGLIDSIINIMEKGRIPDSEIDNIKGILEDINFSLYGIKKLSFQQELISSNYDQLVNEIKTLKRIYQNTLQKRFECSNNVEYRFYYLYEKIKLTDNNTLYEYALNNFLALRENDKKLFIQMKEKFTFLKVYNDYLEQDYSLIKKTIEVLKDNIENYKWLFDNLCDYRSKIALNNILGFWLDYDYAELNQMRELAFSDYFDLDLIQCDENEVVVDGGAFIGDSIKDYIDTYGKYKRIYAYEITPETFNILQQNTKDYENIELRQKGISDINTQLFTSQRVYSGNNISETGDVSVDIVKLDDDIKEPVTLIKMDIEGEEKKALMGAYNHIVNDKPKLLVSAYHNLEDIFMIPILIKNMRDDYKFYLRYNGGNSIWPCDYILIAV